MRRDQSILVEGVLRDFPRINKDRLNWELWLEALAISPGSTGERVDGGEYTPLQDRFLRAMDGRYVKKLQRIVSVIYDDYKKLSEPERRVIALSCFDDVDLSGVSAELDITYRSVQRLKASAYEKMKSACMAVISDVDDWRTMEHNELKKQISLLRDTIKSYQ